MLTANEHDQRRAEGVTTKPSFRNAFKSRRWLIPADGFYEWRSTPHGKQPYRITLADGSMFAFDSLNVARVQARQKASAEKIGPVEIRGMLAAMRTDLVEKKDAGRVSERERR